MTGNKSHHATDMAKNLSLIRFILLLGMGGINLLRRVPGGLFANSEFDAPATLAVLCLPTPLTS
jgi:hypothetical protein